MKLRLGTRASALALAQAELVAGALPADVEIVPITTSGDEGGRGAPVEDKSRFVKEIEEALLREELDLAVHSAKDVPTVLPDGLSIVGVPERADARDALCGAALLSELDAGAIVGTSSLRRRSQLLAVRPDLDVRDLRGNVDTRLRKLAEGHYAAIVLAAAGLARLGRAEEGEPLSEHDLVPAAGQGCLALEARSGTGAAIDAAVELTNQEALVELTAERALVARLEASCHTPVGAHARADGQSLSIAAFVGLPDGSAWVRDVASGDPGKPAALGTEVAERLLAAGAGELLAAADAAAT